MKKAGKYWPVVGVCARVVGCGVEIRLVWVCEQNLASLPCSCRRGLWVVFGWQPAGRTDRTELWSRGVGGFSRWESLVRRELINWRICLFRLAHWSSLPPLLAGAMVEGPAHDAVNPPIKPGHAVASENSPEQLGRRATPRVPPSGLATRAPERNNKSNPVIPNARANAISVFLFIPRIHGAPSLQQLLAGPVLVATMYR